jgi:hypothetical protein
LFSNTNKGYQNDTLNPYFLHPNENLALVLVTPLLNGENYDYGSPIQKQDSIHQWFFSTPH